MQGKYSILAAAAVLLLVALVLVVVLCCCWKCRQRTSHSHHSVIRNSLRRASLYISNTSPLEISVAELVFNLTGGFTAHPHDQQVTGDICTKQPLPAPPTPSLPPPSSPAPTPPEHSECHQACSHLVKCQMTPMSRPKKPDHVDHGVPLCFSQLKNDCQNIVGKIYTDAGGKSHSGKKVEATSHHKALPKSCCRDSIVNTKKNVTMTHGCATTPPLGTEMSSKSGRTDPHPYHHSASKLHHTPRVHPLPDPPVESPEVVVSLFNTVTTPSSTTTMLSPPRTFQSQDQHSGRNTCHFLKSASDHQD